MNIHIENNMKELMKEKFQTFNYNETVKFYIVNLMTDYTNSYIKLSNKSLTLEYDRANNTHDFILFQNIGDWIFFCESVFPEHLKCASKEYYHSLAQISYYKCYTLINKKIDVYERLADEFKLLTKITQKIMQNI